MARRGMRPLRTTMALAFRRGSSSTSQRPMQRRNTTAPSSKIPARSAIWRVRRSFRGAVSEFCSGNIACDSSLGGRMVSLARYVVNWAIAGYTNGLPFLGGRMRAVVTGGAGFLGSHLSDRLIAEGWEVLVLDNLVTGVDSNVAHLLEHPNFRIARCDVSKYIDVPGPVDYVLHFASPASPVDYLKLPIQTLKVGALGTHNALGLALAKKAKFFLASTSECYGDPEISPQHEEYWGHVNPIGPRGVYAEAKRFSEAMTMAYHRYHKVDTHIGRIFNTYGPRMRLSDGRALPNFVSQALSGRPLTIYGDGKQTSTV